MVRVKLVDCMLAKPETLVITHAKKTQNASESDPSAHKIQGAIPKDEGVKETVQETQRSRGDETVNTFNLQMPMKRIRDRFTRF